MKMSVATVSLILLIAFAFTGYGNETQSIDYSQHKNWLALETSGVKEVDVFLCLSICMAKNFKRS